MKPGTKTQKNVKPAVFRDGTTTTCPFCFLELFIRVTPTGVTFNSIYDIYSDEAGNPVLLTTVHRCQARGLFN